MSTYTIDRYLNIRSAYGASFGPAGDQLSFLMNTTGVPQVWTLEEPQGWPEQRTFADERVTFASWSPERPELIFGMDEGGNERAQLFRLDATTGEMTNLTATPEAKHRWGGWSHDGERFAFASNRREGSVFDVYTQRRDAVGDGATLITEGDGWLSVGGFSPDDSRLLVSEAYSNFDQDLYSLEIESGELTHLTPHEGDVRYRSANWGPDGDALYLVTDLHSDTGTLDFARLDLESLGVAVLADGRASGSGEGGSDSDREQTKKQGQEQEQERAWNVGGIAMDDETGRFVYSCNVEGYTELTVGERTGPTSFKRFPTPDLPGGVAGGVSFGPNADRFALSTSGDTVNTNVYVVEVETGEAERFTAAPTAGIPPETFQRSELVSIGSFDGLEVPGFLTLPEAAAETDSDPGDGDGDGDGDGGTTPVIVNIHGGPESQRRPSFSSLKQYFLNRGYAYFEPNVRGSSGYGSEYAGLDDVRKRMDSVADIDACGAWLADHPAIDPDRIVCMGGSYGGFMVLAALTEYPERWAAGIDIVGIANFVTFLENTGDWRRKLREAEYGSLAEDRDFLESISPINNIEGIEAPLFVLHGANDPRVPVGEAKQIVEKAREQGVPVEKLIFEDEGHGFSKLENRLEAYSAVAAFLEEHL